MLTLDVRTHALTAYRAALTDDPDHVRALVGIGNLELEFGQHSESLAAFDRALELMPELAEQAALHRSMGEAAMELGQAGAARYFERALAADPLEYSAMDRLAMLRFNEENYEEARTLYTKMLELRPDSHAVHTNLGLTLHRLGRNDEARERIARALEIDPKYELARSALGLINQ